MSHQVETDLRGHHQHLELADLTLPNTMCEKRHVKSTTTNQSTAHGNDLPLKVVKMNSLRNRCIARELTNSEISIGHNGSCLLCHKKHGRYKHYHFSRLRRPIGLW